MKKVCDKCGVEYPLDTLFENCIMYCKGGKIIEVEDKPVMELWEILVPASNGKLKISFGYAHHKEWDDFVKSLSGGGLTILKTVKGEWESPSGEVFLDRMIPVRVACDREAIEKIIDFTLEHYKQEAVFAYKLSDEVIIKHKQTNE